MAESNDMDQLLAIRNQDEPDELTEEELQMAISADDQDDDDEEEYEDEDEDNDDGQVNDESTECEESFERNGKSDSKQSGGGGTTSDGASCKGVGPGGRPEYQFQMQDHHIFKGKHGKKLYKCDVCSAVYRHSFSLKRHFIRSHVNYGYLCETDVTNCGINLSASASLQTWNGKQYDDKSLHEFRDLFCCHSCVVFFDDLKGLVGHVDGSHRNNKSGTIEPVRIPCSQCNMSFIQRHNLMRHIEVVHQGKKLFTCKYCGRKFQSIADRKRHIKGLHPDELQSSPSHQVQITKTHQCSKCLLIFDSYSSLKKHVIKNHEESYHGCGFCNKFSFTKKQLNDHIKLKHGKTTTTTKKQAIKKIGNNNTNESDGQSTSPSSSSFSSSINSSSYFHCSFCYRRFLTYGSLLRHKQVAHRSYQTTLKSQENTTTTTSPTRLRRTLSQVQVQNHNDNDNLMNQFSEIEFYQNIAQRIAENLLHFVDGKFVNCKSGQQDRMAQTRKVSNKIDSKKSEINLSKYNFPANFNISNEDQVQDDKIEFLSECNLQAKDELRNSDEEDVEVNDQMTDEITTKDLIYVCTACYCHVAPHLFAEHDVNNHPNVKCSFIEVDPKSIPYPLSLLSWDHHQQRLDGLLSKCPMIPILPKDSASSSSIKCTKCFSSFSSVDQLHQHILDCAFKNETAKSNETSASTSTSTSSKTSNEALKTSETSTSKTNETSKSETSKTEVSTPKSIDQSPLSPCKTRSGKRRQTPEKLTPAKRSRDDIKNAKRELFSQEKINKKDGNNQHGNDGHDDHGKDGNNNCKRNTKGIIKQEITVQSVGIQEQINFEEIENNKLALLKPVLKDSKFYSCFKCHKKFLYMDQLKKHQFSICSRRFNNNKNNNKRLKRLRGGIKKKGLKVKLKDILQNQNENNNKRITRKSVVLLNNKIDDTVNVKSDGETENETELSDNQCDDNEDEDNDDGNILDESINNNNSNENTIPKEPHDIKEPDSVHNNQLTPMQEHRCPDCQRVFTYMANFRKHIKNICPVRRQLTDDKCNNNTSLTANTPSNDASEQEDLNETDDIIEINEVKVPEDQEAELKDQDMKDEEMKEEFDDEELQKDESKLDLWRIKQEHPTYAFKGSPAQHHSCPYCQRGFTYLANYRKHIKSICPIRQQIEEKKKKVLREGNEVDDREAGGGDGASVVAGVGAGAGAGVGTGGIKVIKPEPIIPQVQYTPTSMSVRSQIEDTVLTMLRDQTKQHEIIKSTEINDEKNVQKNGNETPQKTEEKESQNQTTKGQSTFRFRTFSCSICHKIFLSYVTMLKHRLSHKLSDGSLGSNDDKNTKLLSLPSSPQLPSDDNQMKEVQNQELAVNLLKRSKTMIQNKLNAKLNLASSSSPSTSSSSNLKIITTELLETLARGGTGTEDSPTSSSAATCSVTKPTKEHNKGNNLTDEIYLNDILTDSNQLIVDQLTEEVQEVITEDKLNEEQLVLDSVDISNGNEVWITFTAQPNVITDSDDLNSGGLNSGAFVQVPCDDTVTYNNNSNNNNNINNSKCTTTTGSTDS